MKLFSLLACLVCSGANVLDVDLRRLGEMELRSMDEGSYEDQGGGSYEDQNDQDPSSPEFTDKAPTAKEVQGMLANQGPVIVAKPKEDKPPTLGSNQQLQDKVVNTPVVKVKMSIPIACKIFNAKSDEGEVTKQVVKDSIAAVSTASVLELQCDTPETRTRGRSLAAGDAAQYTFSVEIPEGTEASVIESNLKTAAGNGNLLNTIKSKALAKGVATEALLSASPILVILQLTQGTVTQTVQVVVDMPNEELTEEEKDDDGLSDGEIAAIVICTLIFVIGVSIGLWAYCKQTETPGKPNNVEPSQPKVYMGGDAIPGAEAENQLEQKIDAPGYNV